MPILVLEQRGVAIDARLAGDRQIGSRAEQVELFELEAGRVLAAAATERHAGIQRPDIAGRDRDIDASVVERDRPDGGVVEIPGRAQDARGLVQQALRVGVAALEQQLLANDVWLRADMHSVRKPVQRLVLLGVFQVEDVLGVNEHIADDGALAFEFCRIWQDWR